MTGQIAEEEEEEKKGQSNRHSGENHCLLTVVRHAHVEALLKAAVLAFVPRLLVNATVEVTVIVDQL